MSNKNLETIIEQVVNESNTYMDMSKFNKAIKAMNDYTDRNHHTEAVLELAELVNHKIYVDVLKLVIQIQKKLQHMPSSLGAYRNDVYKELLKIAEKEYNKEEFALIKGSF